MGCWAAPIVPRRGGVGESRLYQSSLAGCLLSVLHGVCYGPGARLTLHQDKNERDLTAPIVSVSLGLPAVFLFGGATRNQRPVRVPLVHGDVVVWGGPDRLRYHGVLSLKDGHHLRLGSHRFNLTFRRAG